MREEDEVEEDEMHIRDDEEDLMNEEEEVEGEIDCLMEDWILDWDIWNDGVNGVNATVEVAKMAIAIAEVNLILIFLVELENLWWWVVMDWNKMKWGCTQL